MINLLFGVVTASFLAMSVGALFHLRWARRLPALRHLPPEPAPAPSLFSRPRGKQRRSAN
jgi:hypothetical protein